VIGRDDEIFVAQENQPENEVHPRSPIPEHEASPLIEDPTSLKDNENDSLPIKNSTPPKHGVRNTSISQADEGPRLRRSVHGRIPR